LELTRLSAGRISPRISQPRSPAQATASASETVPENVVKNTFLPFHPRAVRYYCAIGLNIPYILCTYSLMRRHNIEGSVSRIARAVMSSAC